MTTARVGIDITAQDRTSAAFMSATRSLQKFSSVAGAALKGFATGFASAALVRGLNATITRMDELTAASQRVGVGVESLSRLGYAAQLSELPFETLLQTSKKLNQNLAAIGAGKGGDAASAMRAIGISAFDSAGKLKSVDQVIVDVAGKFSKYEDGANKVALATALFGKAGQEMIPMLNGGAQAIADANAEADAFGLTLSGPAAEAASTFNDNMDRMTGFIQGTAQTVVSEFLPAINEMIDRFISTGDAGHIAQTAIEGIYSAAEKASAGMSMLATAGAYLNQANAASVFAGRDLNRWLAGDEAGRAEALKIYKEQTAEIWKRSEALDNIISVTRSGPGKGSLPSEARVFDAPSFSRGGGGSAGGGGRRKSASAAKVDQLSLDAARIVESTRTPMEAHMARVAELDKLLGKGYITQTVYNRGFAESQNQYVSAAGALNQFTAEAEASFDPMKKMSGLLQDGLGSAFDKIVDGSASAGQAFKSMAKSILQDATKMFLHQGLQQLFSGGGGLGSAGGGLYGGGGGGFLSSVLGSVFTRLPSFAVGADRVPNDMVARIHKDEMIIPAAGAHALRNAGTNSAGGGMRVQVNNYGSSNVRTTRDGDGGLRIDIVEAVSQVIAGGGANKAMRAQFGLTPGRTPR
jgi:hypothetical protein